MSTKRANRTARRAGAPKVERAVAAPAGPRSRGVGRSRRPEKRPPDNAVADDVPFTARLPDGRTLFVLVPGKWCEIDVTGELLFKPEAMPFLDRAMVLAMRVPKTPTPGLIRTLRDALGLTQKQLGQRIGVDPLSVSRWERGAVKPSPAALRALERLRKHAGRRGVVIDGT